MNWLEISLEVNGEMAEAVAEVLSRYVPSGVVIESTTIMSDPDSKGQPTGPLRVCAYLPIDDQTDKTRRQIEQSLYFLGRIHPLPAPQFTPITETDWSEAWKKNFHPVPIGNQLIIVPAWLEVPDKNRIPIRIDPCKAFGTGTHPSTQLCLEFLETRLLNADVLDVGCGSGILSIAALKLGAKRAFGVDTNPDAISIAAENAAANGVAGRAAFSIGSVAEIQSGAFPVRQAPIVVANILTHILIRLLDAGLGELVSPDGELLLSGILEEQLPKIEAALHTHGFEIHEKRQIEDWVAVASAERRKSFRS
ncbi:MAG: 50S ribosomal protein L11 methyltransferase [Chloroflexota bacterium]|nr:50S ribosomal protein L11 methyltransferase [Chloroflexota bacterium]